MKLTENCGVFDDIFLTSVDSIALFKKSTNLRTTCLLWLV